jgi:hypothetical protein
MIVLDFRLCQVLAVRVVVQEEQEGLGELGELDALEERVEIGESMLEIREWGKWRRGKWMVKLRIRSDDAWVV